MDLPVAQWVPAEPDHFEQARGWRNADLAGLRTPMMLSEMQQRAFVESLADRASPHRFWALVIPLGQVGHRTRALVGLTDIQWENGLAEMSLVILPGAPDGIWRDAVDFVLAEAFDRMRLVTVCVETYASAPERMAFWDMQWLRYCPAPVPATLPRRKWWDGRLWDSTYFTFTAEGYRLARQTMVPA